jgi:hypothetical protein
VNEGDLAKLEQHLGGIIEAFTGCHNTQSTRYDIECAVNHALSELGLYMELAVDVTMGRQEQAMINIRPTWPGERDKPKPVIYDPIEETQEETK